jgi:ketosteroid isomerase-like protein
VHANEEVINKFYEAFAKRDHEGMASCYHDEIRFSDPVFPNLEGPAAGAMWRMLCERGADLVIEHSKVSASDTEGSAHWDARYTFSATGRKVLNRIDASFRFKDGKIIQHDDVFDLWAWSRMALGLPGMLLGWTPIIRNKVQGQAGGQLKRFMEKNNIG